MTDDWSLKGKGWIDTPDLDMTVDEYNAWKIGEAQSLATTNVKLKSEDDVKVYPKEVIETLRQKLIEDFNNWCSERLEYEKDGMRHISTDEIGIQEFIKERINKRFGVEE